MTKASVVASSKTVATAMANDGYDVIDDDDDDDNDDDDGGDNNAASVAVAHDSDDDHDDDKALAACLMTLTITWRKRKRKYSSPILTAQFFFLAFSAQFSSKVLKNINKNGNSTAVPPVSEVLAFLV